MRLSVLVLTLALAGTGTARAEDQPRPPPPKTSSADKPVRVGPTTVTVIDENESVDDIISRVRKARQQHAAGTQPPAVQPPRNPPASDDHRTKLRDGKDDDRAARKQARERLQRLRETARERRANRLRGARAE